MWENIKYVRADNEENQGRRHVEKVDIAMAQVNASMRPGPVSTSASQLRSIIYAEEIKRGVHLLPAHGQLVELPVNVCAKRFISSREELNFSYDRRNEYINSIPFFTYS